jgi:hypothetical protein
MTAVSPTPSERARKSAVTILRAMQEPGRQVAIATAAGVSESTISRFKSEQIDQFCVFLAHAGLKVVPVEMQCFQPEKIQALLTLAKDHLRAIQTPDQLIWD